jgi:hypothetical protein
MVEAEQSHSASSNSTSPTSKAAKHQQKREQRKFNAASASTASLINVPTDGKQSAWIIGDVSDELDSRLQTNASLTHLPQYCLHRKRVINQKLKDLQVSKPSILWINLPTVPKQTDGSQRKYKYLMDNLSLLVEKQLRSGREVMIDGQINHCLHRGLMEAYLTTHSAAPDTQHDTPPHTTTDSTTTTLHTRHHTSPDDDDDLGEHADEELF